MCPSDLRSQQMDLNVQIRKYLTICYAAIVAAAGSIGTHLRAKVQLHAPSLLDAALIDVAFITS